MRLLVSEIPFETPPIEILIARAKAHKLPLDELHYYVLGRFAAVEQMEQPEQFIADVNHWQHILNLVKAAMASP
jgi:hypothetical protein